MTRALIVDDDVVILMILRRIITEELGWSAIETDNGKTALNLYRTEKPDIVLIDLEMPTMGGRELYVRLRQEFREALAPVVIVTGHSDKNRIMALITGGVSEILLKPFDVKNTKERLAELVGVSKK